MQVDYIRKFLETNYTDEQLSALLAHTQEGRLSYWSCCCLIGIPTADHALRGYLKHDSDYGLHVGKGRALPFGAEAERQFIDIGSGDIERRERLLPIIREVMERRETEKLKEMSVTGELAEV